MLLIVAATAAGTLMIGMFRQSATAQSGQAAAEIGRACRREETQRAHGEVALGQDRQALAVADETFRATRSALIRPGVNMMGTYALAGEPDSTVLFRRDTASIRGERQFDHIVKRIGLEDYWRDRGLAPTFRDELSRAAQLRKVRYIPGSA